MRLYAKSGVTIHIGRAGENFATEVYFDITDWVNDFPNGTPTLVVQQNGATYMQLSHVIYGEKTAAGKYSYVYVVWDTTKSNNATAGMGKCQVFYAQRDSSVTGGERIVKSAIYDIIVTTSLGDGEDEPPAAYKSWVDDITQKANDIISNIDKALAAATEATQSATKAKASEQNAKASETAAKASENAAKASELAAKDSETKAKASENAAKASELAAKASELAAAQSEQNAKDSEDAAKASELAAKASEDAAKASEIAASVSETNAKNSEIAAKNSEENAAESEENAAKSADEAKASEDAAKASENAAALSEKNAKDSENAAKDSENAAKASELAAKASEEAAAESEANAAESEAKAKASEEAAALSESNVAKSEENAAASEANAAESEANAKESEEAAADSALLSKSWAVGDTGIREGEDKNNSKYWADVAATVVSQGGVASWNGRGGNVMPQAGDYTPDMVGAMSKEDTEAALKELDDTVTEKIEDFDETITKKISDFDEEVTQTISDLKEDVAEAIEKNIARGHYVQLLSGEENWKEEEQPDGRLLRYQIISDEYFVDEGYAYFIAPIDECLDDYLDAYAKPKDITVNGQLKVYADYAIDKVITLKIVRVQTIDE